MSHVHTVARRDPAAHAVLLVLGLVVIAAPAPRAGADAAPAPAATGAPARERADRLAHDSIDAYLRGDFARSEKLLREQMALQPDNFVVYYNLACCRAQLGDADGAVELLHDAVDHGFSDIHQLRRDDSLTSLRANQKFKDLLWGWDAILEARRDANLEWNKRQFREGYQETLDPRLRLAYLSAFDARAFEQARAELSLVAEWMARDVMPDILDDKLSREDAWVVVVLPTRPDFTRWATALYGEGAVRGTSMIAGSYEHDPKRLVSMDLGATLRHEFAHVLHWRHVTRLGQPHPIWVMEGLCSLPEDYDVDAQGRMVPSISWRTNIVKRLEKIGGLVPIEQMAGLSQQKFTGGRPLAMYAQARTFFLYLSQRGKLRDWYADFTTTFDQDRTGVASLERALDMPAAEINKDFRAWVRALPSVPEQIAPGMASLGMEVDSGKGEGPIITRIDRSRKTAVGGLRENDIITSIDKKPVRDIAELVRVLGAYSPGDQVEIEYRRVKLYGTAKVTLVAAQ